MKRLPLLLAVLCVTLPSFANSTQRPVESLPAFTVWPLFTLRVPAPPDSGKNVFSFLTIDDVPPSRWHGFIKFRSASLKPGDQVVAIEGKPVEKMALNEGNRLLSFAEPGKKISVEVRQPGSKEIRKAVIVRLDNSTEIDR